MKIKSLLLCVIISCSAIALPESKYPSVCFTPNIQCRNNIINEINDAKKSIKVQAYGFTDILIAHALVNMHKQGVCVFVILDKSNKKSKHSVWPLLIRNYISVKFDCANGIAHNKIMIIDDVKIITGSYNFSANAYKVNRENLLIMHDKLLANKYVVNFNYRWMKSK